MPRDPARLGALVLLLALTLSLVACRAGSKPSNASVLKAGPTSEPTVEASPTLVPPTATPDVPRPGNPGDRLVLKRFGISAPLHLKVVGADGQMPDPDNPDEVVVYDFSNFQGLGGVPGQGGNTVFSGHVDSGFKPCKNGTVKPPCTAVFWDLRQVKTGDEIEVHVLDRVYTYRVTANQAVTAGTANWDQIVARTEQESITLLTCDGTFNPATHEYDQRHIVVAVRVV